jgi:hypothetical protein
MLTHHSFQIDGLKLFGRMDMNSGHLRIDGRVEYATMWHG